MSSEMDRGGGMAGRLRYGIGRLAKKLRPSALLRTRLAHGAMHQSGCQLVDVDMGRHSYCAYDCTIIDCEIGAYCSIANGVTIGGASHPLDFQRGGTFPPHRPSECGNFA
ncbi:hypothetical protein ACUJ46_05165 [Sandaracinobacteroides sp. A072]|uniref:hypothetical protein n=1 Tax=Sandaracinobacteroides sp. A072 TaxID=3461146 RepID=UPI004041D11E